MDEQKLIEDAVKAIAEAPTYDSFTDGVRVEQLIRLWHSGNEEKCAKQAYEWVKTGVLPYKAFHAFIHELVA